MYLCQKVDLHKVRSFPPSFICGAKPVGWGQTLALQAWLQNGVGQKLCRLMYHMQPSTEATFGSDGLAWVPDHLTQVDPF